MYVVYVCVHDSFVGSRYLAVYVTICSQIFLGIVLSISLKKLRDTDLAVYDIRSDTDAPKSVLNHCDIMCAKISTVVMMQWR